MRAQKVKGTQDLLGRDMRAWQRMQQIAAEVFGPYGFEPVETPAIEQVDVFVHGIGQSTDVVRKEMFRVFAGANMETILSRGSEDGLKAGQRLALRPEGTAGVVRAVVENNLVPQGATPVKLYYAEAMFRGERPQKGRLRQFHQVGIEWLGAPDPAADAECIIMLMEFYKRLGFDLSKLRLLINSMGDQACRPAYRDQVRAFILEHADEMCDECRERAEVNPLRAFDCKNDHCREVMAAAPLMRDHLCDECRDHYAQVKRYLDEAATALGPACPPLLRKDFLFDPLQIAATAATPASALLLIVRLAPDAGLLRELREQAESFGMQAVVEIFDTEDLQLARQSGARIIQVNARDLETFAVDSNACLELIRRCPPEGEERWIAASGLSRTEHLRAAAEVGYDAVLIGTALMEQEDPGVALRRLLRGQGGNLNRSSGGKETPSFPQRAFAEGDTGHAAGTSQRKNRVFPRNDRPYDLKCEAFQTEML